MGPTHKQAEKIERVAPVVIEKIRSMMADLTRSQRSDPAENEKGGTMQRRLDLLLILG